MAVSKFGNSYAAASLGLDPAATGGQDIGQVLKTQLAEQAKKRGIRRQTTASAAATDLGILGSKANG